MLTFDKFTGINNTVPPERLKKHELVEALNVDIGNDGELRRRLGYERLSAACHRNLWQGSGFMLATVADAGLVAIKDGAETQVMPALGAERVWYANLPDGRTLFGNGLVDGTTDGGPARPLGVALPAIQGSFTSIPGDLSPGVYQWHMTAVRAEDRVESGSVRGGVVEITEGGLLLTGLPTRAGHTLNIYLTGANGSEIYFAGSAFGPSFSFTGKNDALVVPCRTRNLSPLPAGALYSFWRGRVLVAKDNALYASLPNQWGLHDPAKDVKQFSAPITLIQPVESGVFVGTEEELVLLRGDTFDGLTFIQKVSGRVVLGSGTTVPGEKIVRGDGVGTGTSMICIVGGMLVAGFGDGEVIAFQDGKYRTDVQSVYSTFREVRDIPQYVAVPA